MYTAYDQQNNRIDVEDAVRGESYFCPVCKNKVIIKEGKINAKHFAHMSGECTDHWHYDMSEWHRKKQSYFPIENREVVLRHKNKIHRADILINKTVIEFQHSPITAEEFMERNSFFNSLGLRIVWVFDISVAFESNNLIYSENKDNLMIWKKPMRIFSELPFISDDNKSFSLWFSWDSNNEYEDVINKVIWAIRDEYNTYSFNRFMVSPYYIDLKDKIDVDDFFRSKTDFFKLALSDLNKISSYKIKYIGEKCHPRDSYICPKTQKFGITLFGETGCRYCRYCYMVAQKGNQKPIKRAIYCCYPNQVRELHEGHPGYECDDAPVYEL